MNTLMTSTPSRVLSGYKDIASFLGVSTKTIQRHLKTIPVSRLGKKIIILESDLIDWVRKTPQRFEKKAS